MARLGIPAVRAEVPLPQELEPLRRLGLRQPRLHLAARQHLQGIRVQALDEILPRRVRVGVGEQAVVQPDLRVHGGGRVHPVDGGPLHLPPVGGIAAPAVRVVLGEDLRHPAVPVRLTAHALDEVGPLQAALRAVGAQPLVLGHGLGEEVLCLHPQVPGEGDGMGALLRAEGVVLHLEGLGLPLGVVDQGELHGPEHRHHPPGGLVQILPEAVFQEGVFNGVVRLGHPHPVAEIADGAGGVAPPPQAAQGRHTGIVPAGHPALLHQLAQLPLGHDGVVDAQPGEFDLPGLVVGDGHVLGHPVVQGAVGLKLQGAEGVGDALQGVLDGVGEVVHGVDAPLVPLAVVVGVVDPVDHRVPHIEVAGGQVDLGPEGVPSVLKFPVLHPFKEVQGLLHRPVPPGGGGGHADGAPVLLELLRGQLAHVGQPLFDQLHRVLVHLGEVVGGIEKAVPPVEAQPVDVLLDGLHVLHVLLGGVGVVHAEIAQAAVFLGGAEVDGQGLAVADVEIAVGLGGEPGVDSHALVLPALSDVLVDEVVDKVLAHGYVQFFCHACHSSIKS